MTVSGGAAIVRRLVDTVSKDGFYLLNVSPKADGTIPLDQQRTLLEVGAWLDVNGEAIYDTHAWIQHADKEWRFTVRNGALYAIGPAAGAIAQLSSITPQQGRVTKVEMLGRRGALAFAQDAGGLRVQLQSAVAGEFPLALKISGLDPR
jgi:alpha-L-fucosidase